MKILIIEDEVLTANDLADMLVQLPGQIEINKILPSVAEAVRFLRDNEPPDLIFSDIQLQDGPSFDIYRQIHVSAPIIFCTAFNEYALEAIKSNGIDYVLKPFDEDELLCKIKALTRRTVQVQNNSTQQDLQIGKFVLSLNYQSLLIGAQQKRLTERECEVLKYLSNHRNKIIKREDMLLALWGENNYFYGRSLDVFITKIRKYLKDDPNISIENVFGVGFVFHCE